MTQLLKAQLRKRPTYEVLLKDTVLNPKDKIDLPDREATIKTKTQQLTRYDEAEFLDLEKDNENIQKAKMQQANLKAAAGDNPDSSIAEQTALAPGRHDGHDFKPNPKGKGKGGGKAGGGPAPQNDGHKPPPQIRWSRVVFKRLRWNPRKWPKRNESNNSNFNTNRFDANV